MHFVLKNIELVFSGPLLAFIDRYGVLTNQWNWLYEALLEVSMTKIALWIRVCADDWAAESAIKASNDSTINDISYWFGILTYTGVLWIFIKILSNSIMVLVADPVWGGGEGAMPPSFCPVKISHKKDGLQKLPHRFHVFVPTPAPSLNPATGSATD